MKFFPHLLLLVFLGVSCKEEVQDRGNYKYSVSSWQGTDAFAPQFSQAINKSRRLISESNRYSGLPGAQIAVMSNGELVWSENFGFANLEKGKPVNANTLFRMASVSKILTAAAVGKLVEEKNLDLDKPVIHYLPSLPADYKDITTRHLVSHQSGIRHYYGIDPSSKTKHYNHPQDAMKEFIHAPLLFEPGTDVEYSTYGWTVIEAIIEQISGKPFLSYMKDEIWKPLGMQNTFGDIPGARINDVTAFYIRDSPEGNWKEAPDEDLSFSWAGAGLLSNANDLVIYGNKLINGNQLSKQISELLFTEQITSNNMPTGFGVGFIKYDVTGLNVIGMGGNKPTAKSYLMIFPDEDVVIAYAANTSLVNFSDETVMAIAKLFILEKRNPNCFLFDRTLYPIWKGTWQIELENNTGKFDQISLHFYQNKADLEGMILSENALPRHMEIIKMTPDSLEVLATFQANTSRIALGFENNKLTGTSYFEKPMSRFQRKELQRKSDILRWLEPKELKGGVKLGDQ